MFGSNSNQRTKNSPQRCIPQLSAVRTEGMFSSAHSHIISFSRSRADSIAVRSNADAMPRRRYSAFVSAPTMQQHISMDEIYGLYPTLHEASEEKFLDVMAKRISRDDLPTQLQMLRRAIGYSQKMLADKSGVTLRMIQQYEQRAKDINKASGANLAALAQILGCRMEDLMEG